MAGGHRSLAQEPTSTSPARSQVPSSLAAMVTSSYALAHLVMPVLARTRSPRRRRLEQQPAAARGTASRADGGSRRTKPASGGLQASRSRPCGRPTAARSWPVAGERRAVSRTTTAGEPTACARLSFILEYGSRKWWRAPQNSGIGLALGARSCYKQLGYSVFSLVHVAWL